MVIKTLDRLVEQRIITGYNKYDLRLEEISPYRLILRNMHETTGYLLDVMKSLRELDYPYSSTLIQIRYRYTYHLWEIDYNIKDERGNPLNNLIIRRNGKELDLSGKAMTLRELEYDEKTVQGLIAENRAYEIGISSFYKEEIIELARVFSEKANNENKNSWNDAYKKPVIIIHNINNLKEYKKTQRYQKNFEKGEVSFITKDLDDKIHNKLLEIGFEKSRCLVNKEF